MTSIDLRSDTVTLPSREMKNAMITAELGDDVIDVDPTLKRLEQKVAEVLGMESAIFMPSGTMTNQIAIRLHCRQGDELICEEGCHIYNYEQAGFAQLTGVVARPVSAKDFKLTLADVQDKIRPINEHMARTRLICIENTHNRGGGSILPMTNVKEITNWAKEAGLASHLDGARLFNATVATGTAAADWASQFDTVSVCFSKGLGAPIGSALAGSQSDIEQARRHRKLFGGGMRQVGVIAAAALYALENNVERLAEDHARAKLIAEAIDSSEKLSLEPAQVDTNIVIFRVDESGMDAAAFVEKLEAKGVRTLAFSNQHVRVVTHMHISEEDARFAADQILACAT